MVDINPDNIIDLAAELEAVADKLADCTGDDVEPLIKELRRIADDMCRLV